MEEYNHGKEEGALTTSPIRLQAGRDAALRYIIKRDGA
jgi:hypothetical protein